MRNVWRIVALSICLAALASSASAECAWVLWRYELMTLASSPSMPSASTWAVDDTADTRARCESLLTEAGAKSAKEPEVQKVLPTGVIYQRNGVLGARKYKCIPDTVDPRGPKGSAR